MCSWKANRWHSAHSLPRWTSSGEVAAHRALRPRSTSAPLQRAAAGGARRQPQGPHRDRPPSRGPRTDRSGRQRWRDPLRHLFTLRARGECPSDPRRHDHVGQCASRSNCRCGPVVVPGPQRSPGRAQERSLRAAEVSQLVASASRRRSERSGDLVERLVLGVADLLAADAQKAALLVSAGHGLRQSHHKPLVGVDL